MGNQQSISPAQSLSNEDVANAAHAHAAARCGDMRTRLDSLKQPLHVYVSAPLGLRLDSICSRIATHMRADLVEPQDKAAANRVSDYGRSLGDAMVERRPGAHYLWHSNNLLAQRLRYSHAPSDEQSVHVFARSPLDEVLGYARASHELGLISGDEYALLMVQAENDYYSAHRMYGERHALLVFLRPDNRTYDSLVHHLCDDALDGENLLPAYYHHSEHCLDVLYREDAAFVTRYYTLYISMPTAEPGERECLLIAQTILSYVLALVDRQCWGLSALTRERALQDLSEYQGSRAAVLVQQSASSVVAEADSVCLERDPATGYEQAYRSPFAGRPAPANDWPQRQQSPAVAAAAVTSPSSRLSRQRKPNPRHHAKAVV